MYPPSFPTLTPRFTTIVCQRTMTDLDLASDESHRWTYVRSIPSDSFSRYSHQFLNNKSRADGYDYIVHLFTSWMMTRSSTYSMSIGWLIWVEMRLTKSISRTGVGGIKSHKFAKDGETSFLGQQPTWVSA